MFLKLSRVDADEISKTYTNQTTKRLGRGNVRKDFWDYYWRQKKNDWPIADRRVPSLQ